MDALLLAIVALVVGVMNVSCFIIGAKVGQTVSRGEEVKLPTVNPMEMHKAKEAKREAQREQERLDTLLRNIDKYDGTSFGQEDVPGR